MPPIFAPRPLPKMPSRSLSVSSWSGFCSKMGRLDLTLSEVKFPELPPTDLVSAAPSTLMTFTLPSSFSNGRLSISPSIIIAPWSVSSASSFSLVRSIASKATACVSCFKSSSSLNIGQSYGCLFAVYTVAIWFGVPILGILYAFACSYWSCPTAACSSTASWSCTNSMALSSSDS